jgi:hypothetical protein
VKTAKVAKKAQKVQKAAQTRKGAKAQRVPRSQRPQKAQGGPPKAREGAKAEPDQELAVKVAGAEEAVGTEPPGEARRVTVKLLSLNRARDELGLDYDEFDVAVQIGEVPTVVCGPGQWKVAAETVARLRAEDGHPRPLLDRLRLVSSEEGARLLGIGRDRFVRLARAGHIRPVRWYVNQYRAVVWMYVAQELPDFAEQSPALLRGRLPAGLRDAVAGGEDQRARGWRARRTAQLVRDACEAWEEAAVWAAVLGPEIVGEAVPDVYERAYLRKLREALPPGRPGRATPEQIRELTTADHPDEIALALVALADALGRARVQRGAPRPSLPPPLIPPLIPSLVSAPGPAPGRSVGAAQGSSPAAVPDPLSVQVSAPPPPPVSLPAPLPSFPPPPVPLPSVPLPLPHPAAPGQPPRAGAGPVVRGRLRRLLPGRRSVADLAEQPFLHDGHQQPAPPVEDLAARQSAGAGRDG